MRAPTLASFGLLTALLTGACDGEGHEVTMRIDHYLEPCDGAKPRFCLRVLDSSDPEIARASTIGGFQHQLGYVYDVVVFASDNPDEEQSYDLVDVLHREPAEVGARFQLELAPEFVKRVDDEGFVLVGDMAVGCASASMCREVARALVDGQRFSVELSHDATPGSFVAHAVSADS